MPMHHHIDIARKLTDFSKPVWTTHTIGISQYALVELRAT
jgi:hypothetical protein